MIKKSKGKLEIQYPCSTHAKTAKYLWNTGEIYIYRNGETCVTVRLPQKKLMSAVKRESQLDHHKKADVN